MAVYKDCLLQRGYASTQGDGTFPRRGVASVDNRGAGRAPIGSRSGKGDKSGKSLGDCTLLCRFELKRRQSLTEDRSASVSILYLLSSIFGYFGSTSNTSGSGPNESICSLRPPDLRNSPVDEPPSKFSARSISRSPPPSQSAKPRSVSSLVGLAISRRRPVRSIATAVRRARLPSSSIGATSPPGNTSIGNDWIACASSSPGW